MNIEITSLNKFLCKL